MLAAAAGMQSELDATRGSEYFLVSHVIFCVELSFLRLGIRGLSHRIRVRQER